jgi:hypothetical protein
MSPCREGMGKKQKKPGKGKEKTERKTAKGEEKRARRDSRKVGEEDDIEAILVGVLSFLPLSIAASFCSTSTYQRRLKSSTLLRF